MDSQPDDLATLKAELALARARNADDAATIARQKFEIAKVPTVSDLRERQIELTVGAVREALTELAAADDSGGPT